MGHLHLVLTALNLSRYPKCWHFDNFAIGTHTRGRSGPTRQDTNSMAAHLNNEHPEYSRDHLAIKFSVARTGPMDPDRIINAHMEFMAPAKERMT